MGIVCIYESDFDLTYIQENWVYFFLVPPQLSLFQPKARCKAEQ